MKGPEFAPRCAFAPERARELFAGWEPDPRRSAWRVIECDSEETSGEDGRARNVLDGDPRTIWHTAWVAASPPHPHRVTIDLGRIETVEGLRYLPRQDGVNGRVARGRVQVSPDGEAWETAWEGRFGRGPRPGTVRFGAPRRARYLRFIALSEVNGKPWASAAELSPLIAD